MDAYTQQLADWGYSFDPPQPQPQTFQPKNNMDTRRIEDMGREVEVTLMNGDDVPLREIITKDVTDNSDFDTLFYSFSNADAAELVKRWNAFPALLKALEHTIQEDAVNIDWQMVADTIKTFGGEPVTATK